MTKRRSHGELPGETYSEMLKRCGISRRQAHEWIKLANAGDEVEVILESTNARPATRESISRMGSEIRAIKRAPVGGRGRAARPALRLLDSLLALELEIGALDMAAFDDLDAQQRAALSRAATSLIASLQGLRCGEAS